MLRSAEAAAAAPRIREPAAAGRTPELAVAAGSPGHRTPLLAGSDTSLRPAAAAPRPQRPSGRMTAADRRRLQAARDVAAHRPHGRPADSAQDTTNRLRAY